MVLQHLNIIGGSRHPHPHPHSKHRWVWWGNGKSPSLLELSITNDHGRNLQKVTQTWWSKWPTRKRIRFLKSKEYTIRLLFQSYRRLKTRPPPPSRINFQARVSLVGNGKSPSLLELSITNDHGRSLQKRLPKHDDWNSQPENEWDLVLIQRRQYFYHFNNIASLRHTPPLLHESISKHK